MENKQRAETLLNQINQVILTAVAEEEFHIIEIKIDPERSELVFFDREKGHSNYVNIKTPTLDT